jgi:hypothetical protein
MMFHHLRPHEAGCLKQTWFASFINPIRARLVLEQPGTMSYVSFVSFLYFNLGEIEPGRFGANAESFVGLKTALREEW